MESNPLFRLTSRPTGTNQIEIRLEGRLERDSLDAVCGVVDEASGRVTLDVSGLAAVDEESRRFLVGLRGRGCRVAGGSVYIKRLLEEA